MSRRRRVEGEVAVVTGAALGIGKACCIRLAEEGANVAVTDVLEAEGAALAEEIERAGGVARFWKLDVSNEEQCREVMDGVVEAFGSLTVLVNNAGISGVNKPTHEITAEEWNHLLNINLNGVFYCTKHALPHMMRQGRGSIINMSSIYGIVGAPDAPPYHASKGALRVMSKTDALLYATHGIRVNSLHPGFIWTPMVEKHLETLGEVEAGKEALTSLHPIGRLGDPDDIAWGVVYLASDEAKFVTGSELVIDGGYTAR